MLRGVIKRTLRREIAREISRASAAAPVETPSPAVEPPKVEPGSAVANLNYFAVANTYKELQQALRERYVQLGISMAALNDLMGTQEGYANKLLSDHPSKFLGRMSWECLLGGLGLKLFIVEDTVATARLRRRFVPRKVGDTVLARPPQDRRKKPANGGGFSDYTDSGSQT